MPDGLVVEKIQSGLWSLPVPIPDNPLGYTLVHLRETDAGPVLVDAGWDDPTSWQALQDGVGEAGYHLSEVVGVLVTHHHPDHHGLSGQVREASGCWIAMHEADADQVRRHEQFLARGHASRRQRTWESLHVAGAPAEEVEALLRHQEAQDATAPAMPDRPLEDHDVVRVADVVLEAIWTPGHSPGHTCFWLPDLGRLLAGDHLLPTITPHVGLQDPVGDDADPLAAYLASLDRVEALGALEVLPAHEYRFADASSRIAQVRTHHHARLAELLRRLGDGRDRTLWELAQSMTWNRPWSEIPPLMRRVAASEAAAHVRRLERTGHVRRVADAPIRYVAVDGGRGTPLRTE